MDFLERVAREDSLEPWPVWGTGPECFGRGNFHLCASIQDSLVKIEFVQGGTSFSDRSERIRQDVLRRFRQIFGEHRVRECISHGSVCPPLAQIDSAYDGA